MRRSTATRAQRQRSDVGYLHEGHECYTPSNRTHPDQHGTDDEPGTVWECDECGQLWRVRFRSTWNEYERMTPGETRRFRKAQRKGRPVGREEYP